ncbi:PadR family transcriptional regulator [Marivivens marinus]|uniref:PadR family transcriptional regulator n=1 Tax=Marivivens marinus TaxID=3110173 RepID=UPI003B8472A5
MAVLSLLKAHPAHGYDISRAVAEGPLSMLGLSRPAVYAVLDRFARRGWVTGQTQSSGNRPDKTVMLLTKTGAAALAKMQSDTATVAALPVVPLVALLLAHDAGQAIPRATLQALVDMRKSDLAKLEADSDHADSATSALSRRVLRAEIETLESLL